MADIVFLVAGVLCSVLGAWLVSTGRTRKRERERMQSTPTSRISTLTEGPAEIVGTAKPTKEHGTAPAPFTGEDCLVAEWEVEEWDEDDDGGQWGSVGEGVDGVPFLVEDDSGEVLVRPQGATLEIDRTDRQTLEVGSTDPQPDHVQAFIDRTDTPGQPDRPLIAALDWGTQEGDRRYTQRLLTPGEEVYVYGTVQQKPEDDHVWGGNVRNLLIQKLPADATGEEPLFLISDKSEAELVAGRSLAAVWLAAGVLVGLAGLVLVAWGLLG
jgi:hypothetical protein